MPYTLRYILFCTLFQALSLFG